VPVQKVQVDSNTSLDNKVSMDLWGMLTIRKKLFISFLMICQIMNIIRLKVYKTLVLLHTIYFL